MIPQKHVGPSRHATTHGDNSADGDINLLSLSTRVPRLFYEDRGRCEPLLLFTGFSISSAVFEPLADSYGQHFRCLTFDDRGTGRSDRWIGVPSMAALAADGLRVLDAVGVRSAHVYGVSMGGMVAQEYAIRFPDRVRGLILAGTSPGGPLAARPSPRGLGGGRPAGGRRGRFATAAHGWLRRCSRNASRHASRSAPKSCSGTSRCTQRRSGLPPVSSWRACTTIVPRNWIASGLRR
jgi:pimeloyl-ACP methyl ester carboxylesterase